MEKIVELKNTSVNFSIWDLGGQQEFLHMLPLVCNEAIALLFLFDLSRKSTLSSVREWYRQARLINKTAIPLLVGTKYDVFMQSSESDRDETIKQARKYAAAMKAPLVFCSASQGINVQKIFKIILSKTFDVPCQVGKLSASNEPIIEY